MMEKRKRDDSPCQDQGPPAKRPRAPSLPPPPQPITFNFPDPPELPGETTPDGFVIPGYWDLMSSSYCARFDTTTGDYQVRPYRWDHPGGKGPTDFEATIRLVPPSKLPNWHPLLEKWGLQLLNDAGLTTYNSPSQLVSEGRMAGMHLEDPIHPVLRHDMWQNCSPEQYALMRPALLWISAVLDDPDTLRFFAALMDQTMPVASAPHLGEFKYFQPTAPLTTQQCTDTWTKITDMRRYFRWSLADRREMNKIGVFGLTTQVPLPNNQTVQAAYPDTECSTVYITDEYLFHLENYSADPQAYAASIHYSYLSAGMKPDRIIPAHAQSAILRTIMLLANTMLHEFSHAVTKAHFPVTTNNNNQVIYEPFYAGNRVSENGCALETFVYGGMPRGMEFFCPPLDHEYAVMFATAAPFGAYCTRGYMRWFADGGGVDPNAPSRALGPPTWTPEWYFPLPQSWVYKIFSPQVWGKDVGFQGEIYRFGLQALQMPISEVSKWVVPNLPLPNSKGNYGTGAKRWNTGGSRTTPTSMGGAVS